MAERRRRRGRDRAERASTARRIPRARSGRSGRGSTACRRACCAPAASSCSPTMRRSASWRRPIWRRSPPGRWRWCRAAPTPGAPPAGRSPPRPTTRPTAERIDYIFWNHDRHAGNEEAMRAYLRWETELPAEIARDGLAGFRLGPRGEYRSGAGASALPAQAERAISAVSRKPISAPLPRRSQRLRRRRRVSVCDIR